MTSIPNSIDPTPVGPRVPSQASSRAVDAYTPVGALMDFASDAATRRHALKARVAIGRRDPMTLLSIVLVLAVATVAIVRGPADPRPALALAGGFLAIEVLLASVRGGRWHGWLVALRFVAALGFIVLAGLLVDPSGTWPFNSLMIPVVALAAAQSVATGWVVLGALVLAVAPGLILNEHSPELARRLIAWLFAAGVTAIGTRQVVSSLQRSRDRVRQAHGLQRRRGRQLAAVERVGEILARQGSTPAALDAVVGLLADTFGYGFPSIYTWDGDALHLGAQRNYATPIDLFPVDVGVIGRVARTREPVFLPDVSLDPDYVSADNGVLSEISVPLLNHGELLGVLNVEGAGPDRLDPDDFATLKIVGDRLAVALALGRERQNLTERARLMDALVGFSQSLGGSLDPATVQQQVVVGASRVIAADMVLLTLLDAASGEFRAAQVEGGDQAARGIRFLPGEGATGRAIAEGRVVVVDRQERGERPQGTRNLRLAEALAAMSAPLRADQATVGALTWVREDLGRPFSAQEQEVAALLAAQVALASLNAELHHATEVAAVTDPLTGLHNRRYFDASTGRIEAARRRTPEDERRSLSAVMFDLDHFGRMNKLHGHLVGDRILQAFAEVLRHRVRASDLTARYGGEEFVVILDGASRTEAVRLAEEIRESFGGIGFGLADGSAVGCTVSAGCADLAASETDVALVLERADVGLAMAKASGRNRVVAA